MNCLFVTVGTSALINEEIGKAPDRRDNRVLRAEVMRYMGAPKADQRRVARWDGLFRMLVDAHVAYWKCPEEYTLDPDHFRQTSAELTSTFVVRQLLSKRPDGENRMVLLASATPEGRLAAEVNQWVMEDAWQLHDVVIANVAGLDLDCESTPKALDSALANSGAVADSAIAINATGGYKGTAIAMGVLCANRPNWEIYYQHESRSDVMKVKGREEEQVWRPKRSSG